MIDLEKLKPILEPLNLDVETIESIQALDVPYDNSEEVQNLRNEIDKVNNDWNERFKNAFFKGVGVPHDHEGEVTKQVDEQSKEEVKDLTYDSLFKEE